MKEVNAAVRTAAEEFTARAVRMTPGEIYQAALGLPRIVRWEVALNGRGLSADQRYEVAMISPPRCRGLVALDATNGLSQEQRCELALFS